jgi:hypothetical protein
MTSTLSFQCRAARLPLPVPEYRFHLVRRWRFDLAWPVGLGTRSPMPMCCLDTPTAEERWQQLLLVRAKAVG